MEKLLFATSGSTGRPKTYAYEPAVLDEEADALIPYFADRERVVSVMPLKHLFGFVTSRLLPRRMGIPVVCLPPLPVADFFSILRPRDLIVAFPLFWQAVFQRYASPSFSLPGELLGLTASAPCPPEVIEGLTQPGRLTAITEIYGSTETSAVGIRSACREPYDLLSLWDRVTLPDGEPGISRIRADGRREAAQAMPDFVEWRGERTFVPVGRKDNAVQVAGVNVYPARVAAIIRAHPAVKDCAVRLMRPEEGARLKAFIVPEETARPLGRKAFGAEFRAWLRERLDTPSFPKSITLGDALPVSSTGKSSDWG